MVGWIEFGMDSTRAISMELQISFTFLWMGSSSLDFPRFGCVCDQVDTTTTISRVGRRVCDIFSFPVATHGDFC